MSTHSADASSSAASFGDSGVLPGAGLFPGAAGLFPGLGFNKGFSADVSGGFGGGLGGLLGGLPYGGIPFSPYIPATPLGSYFGFKGDLIVPIVVVGFALFLIIVIILAIKAALKFKLGLLAGKKGFVTRASDDDTTEPLGAQRPEENQLNELAHMVLTAIQSQTCAQKVVCEIGTYARERDGLSNLLRILESMVPESMTGPLSILRSSAEGKFDCNDKYPCGGGGGKSKDDTNNNNEKTSTTTENSHDSNHI